MTALDQSLAELVAPEARDVPEIFTTEWLPYDVHPSHAGYYEVRSTIHTDGRYKSHLTGSPFRYWNGEQWLPYKGDSTESIFGKYPTHQWRGLRRQCATAHDLRDALGDYYQRLNWRGNRELEERNSAEA